MSEMPIHTLIRRFSEAWDADLAGVVADWCEEHYLANFVKMLREGIAREGGPEQPWLIFHELENLADLMGVPDIVRAPGNFREWLGRNQQARSTIETLGFDTMFLPAQQTGWVTQTVVLHMRILELKIAEDVADSFNIDQITFNGRETRINSAPVPARNFNLHHPLGFPVLTPGGSIQIQVTNRSNEPAEFRASARVRTMY